MLSSACKFEEKEVKVYYPMRISESRKSFLVEPRIREIFLVEFGILGFGIQIQLKESGIPLTIGIQSPNFTDKESGIQFLESGIHDVESRIEDCPGFPHMGRYIALGKEKLASKHEEIKFPTKC